MWIALFTIASMLFATVAFAAPTGPEGKPIRAMQPDSTILNIRAYGDEFFYYFADEKHYTVMKDPVTKIWYYAKQSGEDVVIDKARKVGSGNYPSKTEILPSDRIRKEIIQKRYDQYVKPGEEMRFREKISRLTKQGRSYQDIAPLVKTYNEKYAPASKSNFRMAPNQKGVQFSQSGEPYGPPPLQTYNNIVGLAVLVEFTDEKGTIAQEKIDRLFNQKGYGDDGHSGSVYDYYYTQTMGTVSLTHLVTNYVMMPKPKSFYLNDPNGSNLFINDVLNKLANDNSFDISKVTEQGDKGISLSFFYAGFSGDVWSGPLWPHASMGGLAGKTLKGKKLWAYQMSDLQDVPVIGTTCHELGHALFGFDDYYDYGHESAGIGEHCLMGSGNNLNGGKSPASINGYLKMAKGWAKEADLTDAIKGIDISPKGDIIAKLKHPTNKTEYYIVETREKNNGIDSFQSYLPSEGVMIWHVDELANPKGLPSDFEDMTPERHYELSLEQADGRFDLEKNKNRGDAGDYWKIGTKMDGKSTPNTSWWSGDKSNISIQMEAKNRVKINFYDGFDFIMTPLVDYFVNPVPVIITCENKATEIRYTANKNGFVDPTLSSPAVKNGVPFLISETSYVTVATFNGTQIAEKKRHLYKKKFTLERGLGIGSNSYTQTTLTSISANKWFGQDLGGLSARNGLVTRTGEESHFQTTFLEACSVSFDWRLDAGSADRIMFATYEYGSPKEILAEIRGTQSEWTTITKYLKAGTTVRWVFTRGSETSYNSDMAEVRKLSLTFPTDDQTVTITKPIESRVELEQGGTLQIVAKNSITANGVRYTTSDKRIATVSPLGVVTALTAGTVNITVNHPGNERYKPSNDAKLTVIIPKKNQVINLAKSEATMPKSAKLSLSTFGISTTSNLTPTYKWDPKDIIRIENGQIESNKESGTCIITILQGGDARYNTATPVTIKLIVGNFEEDMVVFENPKQPIKQVGEQAYVYVRNERKMPVRIRLKLKASKELDAAMNIMGGKASPTGRILSFASSNSSTYSQIMGSDEFIVELNAGESRPISVESNSTLNLSSQKVATVNIAEAVDLNSNKKFGVKIKKAQIEYQDDRVVLRKPIIHHFIGTLPPEVNYIDAAPFIVSSDGAPLDYVKLRTPIASTKYGITNDGIKSSEAQYIFIKNPDANKGGYDEFTAFASDSVKEAELRVKMMIYAGSPIAPGGTVIKNIFANNLTAQYYRPFEVVKIGKEPKVRKAALSYKNGELKLKKIDRLYTKRTKSQANITTRELLTQGDTFQATAIGLRVISTTKVGGNSILTDIAVRNVLPPVLDTYRYMIDEKNKPNHYLEVSGALLGEKTVASFEYFYKQKRKTKKLALVKKQIILKHVSTQKAELIVPTFEPTANSKRYFKFNPNIKIDSGSKIDLIIDNGSGLAVLPLEL